MEHSWLISYVILWILTVALALLVLSHSRLIGLLYARIGPGFARPLPEGPTVGAHIEELEATTLFGQSWTSRFPVDRDTLIVFVSPQCVACNELIPHIKDFQARYRSSMHLYLLSVLGDPAMNRAFVDFVRVGDVPYLIAEHFAARLGVSGTPYAFKLDRNGIVLARGIVNHFEHLISLWNVKELPEGSNTSRSERSEDVIV